MTQVKFIQLGTTDNAIPWGDYSGEASNPKSLKKAKLDYPGAIIFATYINKSGEKTQAIHANGEEYSVGGGGGGTVYVGTYQVSEDGSLPKSATGDAEKGLFFFKDTWPNETPTNATTVPEKFKEGDIYVEKRNINAKALESSGYVYSKGRWEALAGSVKAENVWLKDGQEITEVWGLVKNTHQVPIDALVAAGAMNESDLKIAGGYSLKDLLSGILIKEQPGTADVTEAYLPSKPFTASDGGKSQAPINVYTDESCTTAYKDSLLAGTTVYVKGSYTTTTTCSGSDTAFNIIPKQITTDFNLRKKSDQSALSTTVTADTVQLKFTNDAAVTKGQCTSTLKINGAQMQAISTDKPSTATKAAADADKTLTVYAKYSNNNPGTYTFTLANTNGNKWGRTLYDKDNNVIGSSESVTAPKFAYEVEYSNNKKSTWSELNDKQKLIAYQDKSLATNTYVRTASVTATNNQTDVKFYVPVYKCEYKDTNMPVNSDKWITFVSNFTPSSSNKGTENKYISGPKNQTITLEGSSSNGSVYCIVPASWKLTGVTTSLTTTQAKYDIEAKDTPVKQLEDFLILGDKVTKIPYKIYAYYKADTGWGATNNITFKFS